ncbi:MAG: DegT/DnrJ/EryC1/StrS family aminotransferase [Paludibaculum sp.]
MMSLHGLSHDAWNRYSGGKAWDYRIVAPGYKYNLTDLAASIGIHQLARAEAMRQERESLASRYCEAFADCDAFNCLPGRRTVFTRGICFRCDCGSIASRLIAIHSSINSNQTVSAAPSIGGRCTCIPITRKPLAGSRNTLPPPRLFGNGW